MIPLPVFFIIVCVIWLRTGFCTIIFLSPFIEPVSDFWRRIPQCLGTADRVAHMSPGIEVFRRDRESRDSKTQDGKRKRVREKREREKTAREKRVIEEGKRELWQMQAR